jgi:hypothetical protein
VGGIWVILENFWVFKRGVWLVELYGSEKDSRTVSRREWDYFGWGDAVTLGSH